MTGKEDVFKPYITSLIKADKSNLKILIKKNIKDKRLEFPKRFSRKETDELIDKLTDKIVSLFLKECNQNSIDKAIEWLNKNI